MEWAGRSSLTLGREKGKTPGLEHAPFRVPTGWLQVPFQKLTGGVTALHAEQSLDLHTHRERLSSVKTQVSIPQTEPVLFTALRICHSTFSPSVIQLENIPLCGFS